MPKRNKRSIRVLNRAPAERPTPTSEFGRLAKQLTEFRQADEILDGAASLSRNDPNGPHDLIATVREELVIREHSLKQHMAWVEPETIEDALALSVLIFETADVIKVQYVDPQFHGEASGPADERELWHYRCDMPMMESMLHNLVRCLKRHAKTNVTGCETWLEGIGPSFSFELAAALAAVKHLKSSARAANDIAA